MWKLDIMALATVKSYGGKMNLLVQPSYSFKCPSVLTVLSMARITVVPTGTDLAVQVFGMVHNPYGFLVHNHLLGVCLVLGEVFHINVAEVTQAGMQGDVGKVNTLDFHTLHQLAAEVQAGGRRRNSSFVACKK